MSTWDSMSRKQKILALVGDSVTDLLYYDRKCDEDLPVGAIEEAVNSGEISVDEIMWAFRARIQNAVNRAAGRG